MKRYDLVHISSGTDAFDDYDDLRIKPSGGWVHYEEAAALIAEKDAEIAVLTNSPITEEVNDILRSQLRASNEKLVAAEAMCERMRLLEHAVRADKVACVYQHTGRNAYGGWLLSEYIDVRKVLDIMDSLPDNLTALRQHDAELLEKVAKWFDDREFVECTGNQIVVTAYAEQEIRSMAAEILEGKS